MSMHRTIHMRNIIATTIGMSYVMICSSTKRFILGQPLLPSPAYVRTQILLQRRRCYSPYGCWRLPLCANHYHPELFRDFSAALSNIFQQNKLYCSKLYSTSKATVQIIGQSNNKIYMDQTQIPSNITNNTATATSDGDLLWEKFEFSDSPKLDSRFGKVEYNHTNSTEMSKDALLESLHQQEATYDEQYAMLIRKKNNAWMNIPPVTLQHAISFIQPYIQEERIRRIQTVLGQRTKNVRFLFESTFGFSFVYYFYM
jgi:hypothetical protein